MWKWFCLIPLLSLPALADQCQITSPLPMPITISGCTYSGNLPGNSTSYIQNTLSPSTTSQMFSVQTSSTSQGEYLSYISGTQCLEEVNGETVGTGLACGSGGGGGSGIVSPGTFTWTNAFGIQASTVNLTQDNTFYSLGAVNLGQMANIANVNGLQNGNFLSWTNGTSFVNTGLGGSHGEQLEPVSESPRRRRNHSSASLRSRTTRFTPCSTRSTFNNGTGDQ